MAERMKVKRLLHLATLNTRQDASRHVRALTYGAAHDELQMVGLAGKKTQVAIFGDYL